MDARVALFCILCVFVNSASSNYTDRLKGKSHSRRAKSINGWDIVKQEIENKVVLATSHLISPVAGYVGGAVVRHFLASRSEVRQTRVARADRQPVASPGGVGSTDRWKSVNLYAETKPARYRLSDQYNANPRRSNRMVTASPSVNAYDDETDYSSSGDSDSDSCSHDSDCSCDDSDCSSDDNATNGCSCSDCSEGSSTGSDCSSDSGSGSGSESDESGSSDESDYTSSDSDGSAGSDSSDDESDDESGVVEGEKNDRPHVLIISQEKLSRYDDSLKIQEIQFDAVDVSREDNSEELVERHEAAVDCSYHSGDSTWEDLWSWEIDKVESRLDKKSDGPNTPAVYMSGAVEMLFSGPLQLMVNVF